MVENLNAGELAAYFLRPETGQATVRAILDCHAHGARHDIGRVRPVNRLISPGTGWPVFWLVFVFSWAHMGFYRLILPAKGNR